MSATIPFAESFVDAAGWFIEYMSMNINGHDVEMVRYNNNDEAVCVMVDDHMAQMPMTEVNAFVCDELANSRL